eukprot:3640990-Pleurochrysis_carterae.AAC.2
MGWDMAEAPARHSEVGKAAAPLAALPSRKAWIFRASASCPSRQPPHRNTCCPPHHAALHVSKILVDEDSAQQRLLDEVVLLIASLCLVQLGNLSKSSGQGFVSSSGGERGC